MSEFLATILTGKLLICLELVMRYQLTPIFCRPWTLNGLSMQLIESHYENNYGGALRRLGVLGRLGVVRRRLGGVGLVLGGVSGQRNRTPARQRLTTGQVSVRVMPSTDCTRATTRRPSSSRAPE